MSQSSNYEKTVAALDDSLDRKDPPIRFKCIWKLNVLYFEYVFNFLDPKASEVFRSLIRLHGYPSSVEIVLQDKNSCLYEKLRDFRKDLM